jgi:hypothetical protein
MFFMTKKRKKRYKKEIYRRKGEIGELSVIGQARTGSRRGARRGWGVDGNLLSLSKGAGADLFISEECPPAPQGGGGGFYGRPATPREAASLGGVMRRLRGWE